jgi:hypothetical protein
VYVVFAALMLLVIELLSYATIQVVSPLLSEPIRTTRDIYREQSALIERWLTAEGRGRDVVDERLGWRYRPAYRNAANRINAQGIRASREYAPIPEPGALRVASYGDSFVYGNEVADADAWTAVVEAEFPSIEMLNYGVGGYGLDQALLRYELEGTELSPQIVVMGFIVDDIRRVVNVYQRFSSSGGGAFTKPRFRRNSTGDLQLLPSPIRSIEDWRPVLQTPSLVTEWGEFDQWYEPLVYENPLHDYSALIRLFTAVWIRVDNRYFDADRLFVGDILNPSAEAFAIQIGVFERFAQRVRANGAEPVILILPSRGELQRAARRERSVYQPLTDNIAAAGIRYWDATEAFIPLIDTTNMNEWFEDGGHYSPRANRIVATWLGPRLLELKNQAPN